MVLEVRLRADFINGSTAISSITSQRSAPGGGRAGHGSCPPKAAYDRCRHANRIMNS